MTNKPKPQQVSSGLTSPIKGHRTRLVFSVKGDFDVGSSLMQLPEPQRRHVAPVLKRTLDGPAGFSVSQVGGVVIKAVRQHLLTPETCSGLEFMKKI